METLRGFLSIQNNRSEKVKLKIVPLSEFHRDDHLVRICISSKKLTCYDHAAPMNNSISHKKLDLPFQDSEASQHALSLNISVPSPVTVTGGNIIAHRRNSSAGKGPREAFVPFLFLRSDGKEEFRARRCRPTTPLCTAWTGRVIHNIRFESGPNNVNAT